MYLKPTNIFECLPHVCFLYKFCLEGTLWLRTWNIFDPRMILFHGSLNSISEDQNLSHLLKIVFNRIFIQHFNRFFVCLLLQYLSLVYKVCTQFCLKRTHYWLLSHLSSGLKIWAKWVSQNSKAQMSNIVSNGTSIQAKLPCFYQGSVR